MPLPPPAASRRASSGTSPGPRCGCAPPARGPPKLPKITPPARVLWGEQDPPNKVAWRDRLGDYFENIEVNTVLDAAHFVHYDQPDLFNAECIKFFTALK